MCMDLFVDNDFGGWEHLRPSDKLFLTREFLQHVISPKEINIDKTAFLTNSSYKDYTEIGKNIF